MKKLLIKIEKIKTKLGNFKKKIKLNQKIFFLFKGYEETIPQNLYILQNQ